MCKARHCITHLLALRIARLQFQALLVCGNCAIKVFQTMKRCAFAAVSFGPLGVQRHALVGVSGGFLEKALAGEACGAI
jgi:hypothetical protein